MKEDNFSLTSGDFPTLGSEKDNSLKKVEPEGDHINKMTSLFNANAPHLVSSPNSSC